MFLVSKKVVGQPILGIDFIAKTKVVLDIGEFRCHFGFAPKVTIQLKSGGKLRGETDSRQSPRWCRQVSCGELTNQQRKLLQGVIQEYQDVLTDRLGSTHLLEYDIRLLDDTPVRLAPYRLAPSKMKFLREHIQQLLKDGVIEPSCSHYSSQMFLVPKHGGTYRAVVDFRALNKRIAIESVPLPDVNSAFHWFANAKYYTTLDLNQAYHQIPLSDR
jgi:hypothetical protein